MIDQRIAWNELYTRTPNGLWDRRPDPLVDRLIADFKTGPILDAGCGDGRNIPSLIKFNPSGGIVALDQSNHALEICRRRFGYPDGLTLVCARIEDDVLFANSFSAVLCLDVLGHVENPTMALTAIRRTMMGEGRLYASLYAPNDAAFEGKTATPGANSEKKLHYCIYSQKEGIAYFGRSEDQVKRLLAEFRIIDFGLRKWMEPPHEGFRNTNHKHASWIVVAEI